MLLNGASPCNVYWQVGSSATLGTTTAFQGNLMALASISLNNGATVIGRLLARNGAVSLINNVLDATRCSDRILVDDDAGHARHPGTGSGNDSTAAAKAADEGRGREGAARHAGEPDHQPTLDHDPQRHDDAASAPRTRPAPRASAPRCAAS